MARPRQIRAAARDTDVPAAPARLKMQELERATGVGRETIRFYIRAGLLPEPHRSARNVAWYDASFVDRIRLVKELQQKRFLPLRVIKTIVDGDTALAPSEVQTLADIDRHLLRAAGVDLQQPPVRLAAAARRFGIPPKDVHALAAVGALDITRRNRTEWLDDAGVRIVELQAKLQAAGFNEAFGFGPENIRLYVEMVRWLAREEVRVFARGVAGKTAAPQVTAMAEAAIEILNQIICVLRTRELLRAVHATVPAQPTGDHPPSPATRQGGRA
jgi:DNA-binding transcriptional MerR regulator